MTDTSKRGFRTRLSHTGRAGKRVHGFVNPPLQRGSTVLYPTVAERRALQAKRDERVTAARFTFDACAGMPDDPPRVRYAWPAAARNRRRTLRVSSARFTRMRAIGPR